MKRCTELRDLSDDHHRTLGLAKRAKEAAARHDATAVQSIWREIRDEYDSLLAEHFFIEEDYLLPPLSAVGGVELVRRVKHDHCALRAQVVNGPYNESALAIFAQRLTDHVRFEERELFPFAEQNLNTADLLQVAGAHREAAANDLSNAGGYHG
ncbi:MAG: hemerythrin domain-containing protein [Rhodobacteraceae bacterium]|nr:hemerythrin domain-containing protein [Paracoccaceae bacterium]